MHITSSTLGPLMTHLPDWLTDFYQANRICPGRCLNGDYPADYQRLLEPLLRYASENRWPVILPSSPGDTLWFYAAAEDAAGLKELRTVLKSALGSADTYIDLPVTRSPTSHAGKVLLARAEAGVIEFTLLEPADKMAQKRVFETLAMVLALYQQRPVLTQGVRRPDGRVLRDFLVACQRHEGRLARGCLQELREHGRFSPRNLLALELMALAAERRWQDILGHARLNELISGRLSQRILRLLLRALGHDYLNPLLAVEGFMELEADRVRSHIRGLQVLFQRVPELPVTAAFSMDWQLWLVGAVLCGYQSLPATLPECVDVHWFRQLQLWAQGGKVDWQGTRPPVTKGGVPENYAQARAHIAALLTADPATLGVLLEQLDQMPKALRQQVAASERLSCRWQRCQQEYQVQLPGWQGWLDRLVSLDAASQGQPLALQLFTQSDSWPRESFVEADFQRALQAGLNAPQQMLLRQAVPVLLPWLEERGVTVRAECWLGWLALFSLDERPDFRDLYLIAPLCTVIGALDDCHRYWSRLLVHIQRIWAKVASVEALPPILELVDVLARLAPREDVLLAGFWRQLASFAEQAGPGLDAAVQLLVMDFSRRLLREKLPAALSSAANSVATFSLEGRVLVISSQRNGEARRAYETLKQYFPGLRVVLNYDADQTPALVQLARTADYFLFVGSEARHHAHRAVTLQRTEVIYPASQGAAALVQAFLLAVEAGRP